MKQPLKAIVYTAPGEIEIRELELGPCGDDDIVVKTIYTMVSAGTELRVLAGHYGAAEKYPVIPGYSVIGEVIAIGSKVQKFRVGDLISGRNPRPVPGINSQWGGQASHHVYATSGEDQPVLLPAGAKPLDYVVAEISAISLRGVEAASPKSGENAVVIGQGMIGAFSAAWLHARGCRVVVTDIAAKRLERALAWGASAAVNGRDADASSRILGLLNGGADIVVESSGTSIGASMAYGLLRRKPQTHGEPVGFYGGNWPRLIMQANYLEPISINPFDFVPGEGVTILAPKDRGIDDRQRAVEFIRRGYLKATDFLDKVLPVSEAPTAYKALRDDKDGQFSLVFDWTKS